MSSYSCDNDDEEIRDCYLQKPKLPARPNQGEVFQTFSKDDDDDDDDDNDDDNDYKIHL